MERPQKMGWTGTAGHKFGLGSVIAGIPPLREPCGGWGGLMPLTSKADVLALLPPPVQIHCFNVTVPGHHPPWDVLDLTHAFTKWPCPSKSPLHLLL